MKGQFLRKTLAVSMALAVMTGISCGAAVSADAADTPAVSLAAVRKLTNDSTISSTLISKGESVTVNAKAAGGQGNYMYAVLYKKKFETQWTVRQGYKDNAVIIVKPFKDTDYDVCVKVKDSSGSIVKKFFTVKVNPKLENHSTISATTIRQGETVNLYASGTGGVGKYTYAVLYKKLSDKNWTVRQGYKDNADIIVRPAKATDYSICVKVKDENGVIAKKFFSVSVKDDTAVTDEVVKLTNAERQKANLTALRKNQTLSEAANQRAKELSELFSHTRPNGQICFSILNEYNIWSWGAAENIAYWYDSPEQVMNGWLNSEGHRENILSADMTDIGVGFYEKDGIKYWVQLFVKLP